MFAQVAQAFQQIAKAVEELWRKLAPMVEAIETQIDVQGAPSGEILYHPGFNQKVFCPGCKGTCSDDELFSLRKAIIHLNDSHKWRREKIADWLDTLDSQPIFYPKINGETP